MSSIVDDLVHVRRFGNIYGPFTSSIPRLNFFIMLVFVQIRERRVSMPKMIEYSAQCEDVGPWRKFILPCVRVTRFCVLLRLSRHFHASIRPVRLDLDISNLCDHCRGDERIVDVEIKVDEVVFVEVN